jgi:hypothetical protein
MFELPSQPQSTSQILETGIQLFKLCFFKVLPLALVDVVFKILLHVTIPELNSPEPAILASAVMDSIIYLFFYLLLLLLLQAAIFYRINAIMTQSDFGNLEALLQGLKKLLPLFLATWLYYFLIGIGLFALIVPGIFLAIALAFFIPLLLFDNAPVFNSFKHSYQLVAGNWGRTVLILAFPFLFSISVGIFLTVIVENILNFSTTLAPEQINEFLQLTYITVDKLLNPLIYTFILVQYNDLKQRKKPFSPVNKQFIA